MHYDFDKIIERRGTNAIKWDLAKEGELPMWVADMDFETAPEIKEVIVERAMHGAYGYSDVTDEWREAVCGWWKSRHHLEINKKDLIFATGIVPAISALVRKFTTPGEKVIFLTPIYNAFYNCVVNSGRNVLECPLAYDDGIYSIDFLRLEEAIADPQASMMILCNPHNPIGKIWPAEELARIGEMALAHGVLVISDEIHCDITRPGTEYVPYASVSETCKIHSITCISPTKTFNLAGIQTAAVFAADPVLRHRAWRGINTDDSGEPNAFAVQAAVAAFTKGGLWRDEMCEYVFKNRDLVSRFLTENIPEIRLVPGDATYLLWLDCSGLPCVKSGKVKNISKAIRETSGLFTSPGEIYGKGGEGFLRLNVACPRALVEDGLSRLKKAVDILNEAD